MFTAAVFLAACQATPRRQPIETQPAIQRAPIVVHAWLTTGDETSLLAQQPDVYLVTDTTFPDAAISTIDVDPGTQHQQMVGFGAAMTDASAYLMMHQMPAKDREALLHDLFGRDNGIGLSFVRVPMGASDFSLRHYSYDDMPASETDSASRSTRIWQRRSRCSGGRSRSIPRSSWSEVRGVRRRG